MSKEISAEEFKNISYGILEYMKYICEKNNIYFILGYGTVLGAVRHNGFIPWDDDIDVCVFRKDYNRLIDAFKKEPESRFRLVSTEVDSRYSLPHMKIVDTSTLLYQSGRRNNFPLGIWIDVFALDNVPDNLNERRKYLKKFEKYQRIWTILEFVSDENTSRGIKGSVASLMRKGWRLLYRNNSRILAIKLERLALKYENINTKEVGVLPFFPYDRNKSIFPREMLSESVPHIFEKDEFNIPKDYDSYLRKIYGDYMTLPPIEKRVTHHSYTVVYKDYIKNSL